MTVFISDVRRPITTRRTLLFIVLFALLVPWLPYIGVDYVLSVIWGYPWIFLLLPGLLLSLLCGLAFLALSFFVARKHEMRNIGLCVLLLTATYMVHMALTNYRFETVWEPAADTIPGEYRGDGRKWVLYEDGRMDCQPPLAEQDAPTALHSQGYWRIGYTAVDLLSPDSTLLKTCHIVRYRDLQFIGPWDELKERTGIFHKWLGLRRVGD